MQTRMGTRSQLGWLMRVIEGRKHLGTDQSGLDSGDSRGIGEKAVGREGRTARNGSQTGLGLW